MIADVVVVGAGATGSLAAHELAQRGLRVIVLEAGDRVETPPRIEDIKRAHYAPPSPGKRVWPVTSPRQSVQRRCWAMIEATVGLFVDDVDHPYTTPPGKPFSWIRSRQVGGRMLLWNKVALRMSDLDFHAASLDGVGDDWPISYADLQPYYDHVERMLGVAGVRDGLEQLPDGPFTTPPPITTAVESLRRTIDGMSPAMHAIRQRVATVDGVPWVAALDADGVELRTGCVATELLMDAAGRRARGVAYIDRATGQRRQVESLFVVLCSSTIESIRLLQASGVATSSGILGKYLMDHTMGIQLDGVLPAADLEVDDVLYVPRFTNLGKQDAGFLRGYGIQIDLIAPRHVSIHSFGETLPRLENTVSLDRGTLDSLGLPTPHIDFEYSDNERAMAAHQLETVRAISRALGLDVVRVQSKHASPGLSIHELGGARMGHDPARSVLDPHNRCWDVENVYVTDGAAFVSGGNQNPTLTMLAITARACEHIASVIR